MSELKHNGVPITVDQGGKFRAKVGGKDVSANTMATLKNIIDKMQPFEAFDIIDYGNDWGDGYDIEKVTGIKKVQRHYRGIVVFTGTGSREYSHGIYRATPDNIKAADALVALTKKNNLIRQEMDAAEYEATEKLVKEFPPANV